MHLPFGMHIRACGDFGCVHAGEAQHLSASCVHGCLPGWGSRRGGAAATLLPQHLLCCGRLPGCLQLSGASWPCLLHLEMCKYYHRVLAQRASRHSKIFDCAPPHHEVWKYYQSTSKEHGKVLQYLIVLRLPHAKFFQHCRLCCNPCVCNVQFVRARAAIIWRALLHLPSS